MNIDIKAIPKYFNKIIRFLKPHIVFIFLISIVGIYGLLIFQINRLSSIEPSDEKINEELNSIKRPRIDQETISKIEQLEDQNVGVQSLFQTARDNPFQDN